MQAFVIRSVAALAFLAPLTLAPAALADPTGGPIVGVQRAPAFTQVVHKVVYNGLEQADFKVVGDGYTTLNVIVKDANGYEIVRTRGPGDNCRVTWYPSRTALYYIYVVNEGATFNNYSWLAY
jgi:hypothetical protein